MDALGMTPRVIGAGLIGLAAVAVGALLVWLLVCDRRDSTADLGEWVRYGSRRVHRGCLTYLRGRGKRAGICRQCRPILWGRGRQWRVPGWWVHDFRRSQSWDAFCAEQRERLDKAREQAEDTARQLRDKLNNESENDR